MDKTQYLALVAQAAAAQQAYHTEDRLVMSDHDYDELIKTLRETEAAHPEWVSGVSVTENVGGALKRGLYEVKHRVPMLSLSNVFTAAELQDMFLRWKGARVHASYKYDGLACQLTYSNRQLVEAATRGDRYTGESILHNVKNFPSVPSSLPRHAPAELEVRGELLMFNDEFERYNQRLTQAGRPLAVNPRNAAAGIARRLRNESQPSAQLVFVPYAVLYPAGGQPEQYAHSLASLMAWGFEMPWLPPQPDFDLTQPLPLVDYLDARLAERPTLPFGIDGMVFRVDDYAQCETLGFTSSSPRWAIAYKFPPEEKTTKVTEIRLQIGRTGNATPVAVVEPILVGGVTVTHATLHNEDHINRLNIAVGDTVIIRRAGDVVPEIAAVISRPQSRVVWSFPSHCDCGEPLVRPDGQANHVCQNDQCHHRILRAFEHFVSRNAMDIEGLGVELLERLIEAEKIRWLPDLYRLTQQDIKDVTSETSDRYAQVVIEAIQKSRKTTVQRFLFALGIPMAGEGTAKRLYEFFGDFNLIRQASPVLLKAVPDVGEIVATSIHTDFEGAQVWLDRLLKDQVLTFQDEMGPSPQFGELHDVAKLLALAGIRGVTPKSAPKYAEQLARLGWPHDHAVLLQVNDPEIVKIHEFMTEHAERLGWVYRDYRLIGRYKDQCRQIEGNQPLVGETYVLTGSFEETLGSRGQLTKQLERLGAKVSGSVSARTTAVFAGESPGANKIDAAVKHAVPVRQAAELAALLAQHSAPPSTT